MFGVKIFKDSNLLIYRWHRKKRIRNKWKKRYGRCVPDTNYYQQGHNIYAHPRFIQKLERRLIKPTKAFLPDWRSYSVMSYVV